MRTTAARPIAVAVALAVLAACGGTSTKSSGPSSSNVAPGSSASAPAAVKILDEVALKASLLTLNEMPPDFKAGKAGPGPTHTYCNYKAPKPKTAVSQDFDSASGDVPSVRESVLQFSDVASAKDALAVERDAFKSCKSDTSDGMTSKYSVVSGPDLGDDSMAVASEITEKSSGISAYLLQYTALVGGAEVIVSYLDLDAPTAALVEPIAQNAVAKYRSAIGQPLASGESSAPGSGSSTPTGLAVAPLSFNSDGSLMGDAHPEFPTGAPGKVDVVAVGPLSKRVNRIAFAFRNNTHYPISHVDFTVAARSNGTLVGTTKADGVVPAQIQPGGIGLAYAGFSDTKVPDGATYDFKADTTSADNSSFNTSVLKVTEVNHAGKTVVGSATNANDAAVTGPYSVDVYCFDNGQLAETDDDYADEDGDLAAGASTTFTVNLYDTPCATYVVGVSGYFS